MDGMPVAMIVSSSLARREITSALPDAPVIEDVPRQRRARVTRPRAARPRAALARTLQRAAVVVAPPPAPQR
jgi:hypothetical protein